MTDSYLTTMVRLACELADGYGASLFWVDGEVLRPYIIYNLPEEYIAGIGTVRVGSQCCGRAVEHKKPWIVTDMLTDPLFAEGRDGAMASLIRAAFSVPVFDDNKVIASLACHFTGPHVPSPLDIERNQVFANLISISLKGRAPCQLGETGFRLGVGQAAQQYNSRANFIIHQSSVEVDTRNLCSVKVHS